ncbi:MAG: TetR/AcrR family transcriptional regulator [Anaerolineaceae bacterium]|nr:TetR/AcrR family transcriptional regulator [Anaerolineaceae bacterium]
MSRKESELDPRVVRSRRQLQKALMELVAEKRYSDLSIQEVTQRAGLNRSTFYLHYTGLHELLEDCGKELFNQLHEVIYEKFNQKKSSASQDIERYTAFVFDHLEKYSSFYRSLLGRNGDLAFQTFFREQLEELIFEPMNINAINTLEQEVVLRFYTAGFTGIAVWWLESEPRISAQEVSHVVVNDLIAGYLKFVAM